MAWLRSYKLCPTGVSRGCVIPGSSLELGSLPSIALAGTGRQGGGEEGVGGHTSNIYAFYFTFQLTNILTVNLTSRKII